MITMIQDVIYHLRINFNESQHLCKRREHIPILYDFLRHSLNV